MRFFRVLPSLGERRDPLDVLISSFVPVFIAELGDKTQLAALALASAQGARGKWVIFAASALALIVCAAIASMLGGFVGSALENPAPLRLIAGLLFVVFGISMLRRKGDEESGSASESPKISAGLFLKVFGMIMIAETGDKTQLTTLVLAGPAGSRWWLVFLGSSLALVLISGLAVMASSLVGRLLSPRQIKYSAVAVFLGVGAIFLVQGVVGLLDDG